MTSGSILDALSKLARVALAAMLLVAAPLAEAATCAVEPAQSSVEAAVVVDLDAPAAQSSDDGDNERQGAVAEQHCIHGHCHHGAPYKGTDYAVSLSSSVSGDVVLPEPGAVVMRPPAGLERPPKA